MAQFELFFQEIFGIAESITGMVAYAVTVTILAVFATIWIGRVSEKAKTLNIKGN